MTTEPAKIHQALAAIMRDCEAIGKDQKNVQQGFKFRGIDQVYGSLHSVLAKHGVICMPVNVQSHTEERTNKNGTLLRHTTSLVTYRFIAEDGSSVEGQVVGEGMDSGDKAASKSLAIAHKYFLLQTFLIPTEDTKDPDAESHEVVENSKPEPPARKKAGTVNFNGPNHQQLFDELASKNIEPEEFMECFKKLKKIPEKATNFFAMTDKTAAQYVGHLDEIDNEVVEWRVLYKP